MLVPPHQHSSFPHRFGHSQIKSTYQSFDTRDDALHENLRLRQIFFNDTSYKESGGRGCDRLLLGLTRTRRETH